LLAKNVGLIAKPLLKKQLLSFHMVLN